MSFRSVGFADNDRGWIGTLTAGYYLWQTDDGGQTLRNITARVGTTDTLGICGLWAVNRDVVYGVGTFFGPARLVKTSNGGLSWKVKNMDQYAGRLIDVGNTLRVPKRRRVGLEDILPDPCGWLCISRTVPSRESRGPQNG